MNPGSSQVQVWICSVSVCQLCWRKNDCHTTVPSLSSYLATSPLHKHSSWLACYLLTLFFPSTLMPWRDQFLEFTKNQMYSWVLNVDEKLLEKQVGVAGKQQHYLSSVAGVRSSSTSSGSLAVLGAPAEFDACSRSPGHFWLLALCLSPLMDVFSSMISRERRGKPHLLAQVFLFSSDPLSFSHQHSWIHQYLWQCSWLQAVSGAEQSQNFILVHLSPWKVLQKHEVTARKGWKFYFTFFFSVTKDKYIQTVIVCGKWDGFNKFFSLQNCYKSSKPIFFLFF